MPHISCRTGVLAGGYICGTWWWGGPTGPCVAQGFDLGVREVGGQEVLVDYVELLVNGPASQQNLTPAVGLTSHFKVRIGPAAECSRSSVDVAAINRSDGYRNLPRCRWYAAGQREASSGCRSSLPAGWWQRGSRHPSLGSPSGGNMEVGTYAREEM